MPEIIKIMYEDGVFKPLETVNLKEKTELTIRIHDKKDAVKHYRGIFGKADTETLRELEEETHAKVFKQ